MEPNVGILFSSFEVWQNALTEYQENSGERYAVVDFHRIGINNVPENARLRLQFKSIRYACVHAFRRNR